MRILYQPYIDLSPDRPKGSYNYIESGYIKGFELTGAETFIWDGKSVDVLHKALTEFRPDTFFGYLRGTSSIDYKCSTWTHPPLIEKLISYKRKHSLNVAMFTHPDSKALLDFTEVDIDPQDPSGAFKYYSAKAPPEPNEEYLVNESFIDVIMHTLSGSVTAPCFKYWLDKGIPVVELPFAADTTVYVPEPKLHNIPKHITYIGGWWPFKGQQMDKYLLHGHKNFGDRFKIHGQNFPYPNHGPLPENKYNSTITNSLITLGFHEPSQVQSRPLHINERVFKTLACQGFLLCDANPALSEYFDNGTIETFSCIEEFNDKIQFYVNNPEARIPFINSGYEAIMNRHTYRHRAEKIIKIFNTKKP